MQRAVLAVLMTAAACAPRFAHVASPAGLEVSVITGRWSNVYLIARGGEAVVVDSGSAPDCEKLDAAIAAAGVHVRAVIVTHAHADHAGCARELQRRGAGVVLGAGDVATAARGTNSPLAPTGLFAAMIAPLFMFPFEPFTPDLAVDHEVDLGAYGFPELRVAPAPGHTPGELVAYAGDAAFVGDMIKGGQVFTHSPTEHLYQGDRSADHAAIATVLARQGTATLYPGHGGSLAAGDVRGWLGAAELHGTRGALAIELDARAELPGGGTGGFRLRHAWGGAVAFVYGIDVRAGDLGSGAELESDEYPVGLALRGQGGALLSASGGFGFGGVRGLGAGRVMGELAAELPVGGARLLGRASIGWRLSGPQYSGADVSALAGLRLGADSPLGEYVRGHGAFVAATYDDQGGTRRFGVALGFELFASRLR